MSNYIKEQKKEDIQIVDIYWDRIYLHVKLAGNNLQQKKYVIATRKEEIMYPIELVGDELIVNITNVNNEKMLTNRNWYIKYFNNNFEYEMVIYERELEEYNKSLENISSELQNEKPWIPYMWKDIPLNMETCYKLKNLDKIYRYSGNNYAYIFTFSILKTREELICAIDSTFMVKNYKPESRWFQSESQKFKRRWMKKIIYILEKGINLVYQAATFLTVKNEKSILIMSETREMGGNLKALDDRLKERGLDKEFQITYHFEKTLEQPRRKIFFIWLKLAVLTAKQDFIFTDDYVPFFKYVNVSPKTKLVQVWHAGVGFKSVGYARFGEKGSPYPFASSHRKYDYAIVGGEALRDVYAEAFGIDRDNCLPYGLMRMDGYLDAQKVENFKKQFYEKNENLKNKKIILFAPTFRGNGQRTAYYPYDILEWDKIFDMCGEEYVFLIKMHPFIIEKLQIDEKYQKCIIDFSEYPDINELFYVTDILITDYSSNIYEFSLQKKPIIFFAYDKNEYELTRSVHRTLDKYAPGKVCTTLDEVIETIQIKDFMMEKLEKFVNENFDNDKGLACDKVIDNIILRKLEEKK